MITLSIIMQKALHLRHLCALQAELDVDPEGHRAEVGKNEPVRFR